MRKSKRVADLAVRTDRKRRGAANILGRKLPRAVVIHTLQTETLCESCAVRIWVADELAGTCSECKRRHTLAADLETILRKHRSIVDEVWRAEDYPGIHFEAIARFSAALEVLKHAAHSAAADVNEQMSDLYDLASDIRNMSRDEKWKAPCSGVRERFHQDRTASAMIEVATNLLVTLPKDVVLEPLDYWPREKIAKQPHS